MHVVDVECLGDYRLRLKFNNGVTKEVDLQNELYGTVFKPLKDPALFKQVRINSTRTTVEWPNGADLAPEYLYEIGRDVESTSKPVAA